MLQQPRLVLTARRSITPRLIERQVHEQPEHQVVCIRAHSCRSERSVHSSCNTLLLSSASGGIDESTGPSGRIDLINVTTPPRQHLRGQPFDLPDWVIRLISV